jgi:hypothetical protein
MADIVWLSKKLATTFKIYLFNMGINRFLLIELMSSVTFCHLQFNSFSLQFDEQRMIFWFLDNFKMITAIHML